MFILGEKCFYFGLYSSHQHLVLEIKLFKLRISNSKTDSHFDDDSWFGENFYFHFKVFKDTHIITFNSNNINGGETWCSFGDGLYTIIQGLPTFFINFVKWDTELLSHWWLETSLYFYLNPVGFFLEMRVASQFNWWHFCLMCWLWLSGLANTRILTRFLDEALRGMTTGSMVSSERVGHFSWYFTIQHDIQLSSLVNCDKHAFAVFLTLRCSKHPVLLGWIFPTFCTRTQTIASKSVPNVVCRLPLHWLNHRL